MLKYFYWFPVLLTIFSQTVLDFGLEPQMQLKAEILKSFSSWQLGDQQAERPTSRAQTKFCVFSFFFLS